MFLQQTKSYDITNIIRIEVIYMARGEIVTQIKQVDPNGVMGKILTQWPRN